MTYFELANMIQDLFELIANYSRDPSQENWDLIIRHSIHIDDKIRENYPQESENQNERLN